MGKQAVRCAHAANALICAMALSSSALGASIPKTRELHVVEQLLVDVLERGFAVSNECTQALIVNRDFHNVECLKHTLSKGLGVAMIVGGSVVKCPQIYNLVVAGNADGISLATQYMEMFMYGTPVAYNLSLGTPFSTWGEGIFLLLQVVVILSLMLHYSGRYGTLALSLAVVVGFMVPACTGRVPLHILTAMMASGIPVTIASKVTTIAAVVRGGATGQLAFITAFLNALGAAARIFTTIQEVDDKVILLGWMCAATMNWAILFLFAIYPRTAEKKKKQ